jgi:hypothetical protein
MPTIKQMCETDFARPIVRKAISGFREALGMQRNTAKIIQDLRKELPVLTEIVDPVVAANARSTAYRSRAHAEAGKILNKFGTGEMEAVLAHTLAPRTAGEFFPGEKFAKAGEQLTEWTVKQLGEIGMSRDQALKFLREDFVRLRGLKGDISRFDSNNIYPATFQPIMRDIRNGFLRSTTNSAFLFSRQLAGSVGRAKYLHPELDRSFKMINNWEGLRKQDIPADDIHKAQEFARGFLNARVSRNDEVVLQTASMLRGLVDQLGEAWGLENVTKKLSARIDDEVIVRAVDNAASWFGSYAMAYNPAMVFRDVLGGSLMAGLKVGGEAAFRGINEVWARGPKGEKLRNRLAAAIDAVEAPNPLSFEAGVSENSVLTSRLGRSVGKLQELGLAPRRWSDIRARITAMRQGEIAIEMHAPKLLSKEISWERFLHKTGLKGSSLTEQEQVRQILLNRETPNVAEAANLYGKMVMKDSNFVYDPANAPTAFRGTVGKLAGQFGIWPISFMEFMRENTVGSRDAAWATKFMMRYAGLTVALSGLSAATGIDTSTWMFSNPLTFQGGPWYQAFRDVTTLGTSTNEFERREASSNVRRMFGNSTTGFMGGILNPFGGATTNLFQAVNEDNPVDALLLGLGFNLVDQQQLATRRQRR